MSAPRNSATPAANIAMPEGQEIINRVFIGGLARDTSELDLENFFSSFGEVVDVRIVCDRKTGLNKGYGFVTFSSTGARDKLLKRGTVDYKGGRKLRLQKAVKKEGTVDYKGGRKLRLRKAIKKEASGQFVQYHNGGTLSTAQNGGVVANQIVLIPLEPSCTYNNHVQQIPQYYVPTHPYSYVQQPATQYYTTAYLF
ncbi:protein boule-like [Montipora foliosa]|uniref:protein boule-like n=1 Tax=Montipora foliosa TaxID=591990 RepID=UPI0035F148B7